MFLRRQKEEDRAEHDAWTELSYWVSGRKIIFQMAEAMEETTLTQTRVEGLDSCW